MSLANKFGIPQGLLDAAKAALDEANEYQKKVQAHMAKKGIKSLNDLTGDQKKKFFNDLDAMHTAKHEEVEQVEEGSGPKEKQKTPYRNINSPVSRAAADKRREEMDKEEKSEKGKKLLGKIAAKNEEVESVEEAQSHQAKTTMKHISKPTAGEKKAAKDIKPGVAGYRDRVAMLKSAEARGALKKEEVELTQEDLDFIASLNQIDEVDQLAIRMGSGGPGFNKTPAGKAREVMRKQEHLKGQMKFTKSQGGLAGPKGKLPEEVELDEVSLNALKNYFKPAVADLSNRQIKLNTGVGDANDAKKVQDRVKGLSRASAKIASKMEEVELEEEQFDLEDFTLEQIEEYMQTEEFSQLDELSKDTIARYIKKRSHDVATQGALTRAHTMDSDAKRKEQNYRGARDSNDKANRAFMKGWKHRENIAKAVDRLTKG